VKRNLPKQVILLLGRQYSQYRNRTSKSKFQQRIRYKLLLLYRLHHHIAKHVENYFWVANNSDFKLDKTEEHIREYFDIPELTKDKENYAKLSTEPKYRHLTGDTHSVTSPYTSHLFIKKSFVVFRL